MSQIIGFILWLTASFGVGTPPVTCDPPKDVFVTSQHCSTSAPSDQNSTSDSDEWKKAGQSGINNGV